jgi:hypothetical protein
MKILLIVLIIVLVWSLWGYFSSHVEQARYTVSKKGAGYEIREYAAHVEARTTVTGTHDAAMNKGFSIVAGYIFGGNSKKEGVAMTAPVREESVKIAMTAPVVESASGNAHTISFVMPAGSTLATLPSPTDTHVQLVEVPAKKVAVLRYSLWNSASRIGEMQVRLLALLASDQVETVGSPSYAAYNAPWTPPWMTRYEAMVEVR